MGTFDDLSTKGKDMMDDPDQREKIEQMAKEHNISMEEAKQRFMNRE